jgi:hypothetical protein
MTEPNEVPPSPAEAAAAVDRPPTPAEAAGAPPPADQTPTVPVDESAADSTADERAEVMADSPDDSAAETPAASRPPRPFWRAVGHTLAHLLSMAAVVFVLVGLAPRVEALCERMQYDDRWALTTFVFDAGYFVRKSWYLLPLLLLFDLGLLMFLRRAFDPKLARHYTTIVVGVSLLLTVILGYGLIDPLTVLYKRHF